MMKRLIQTSFSLSIAYLILFAQTSQSQVIPDQSLPNNSTVKNSINQINISNGTTRGNNLFHSFKKFDIPSGKTANFDNSTLIKNIITRVTGTSASSIDGSILLKGNTNLFFLNKNGITFGPNARLNFNGSFLASTANSILFDDGFSFDSQEIHDSSLLSTLFPSQLLFTNNQSSIQINGNGGYFDLSTFLAKLKPAALVEGLQTMPGQSLNIVAGKVLLDGGLLSVSQGLMNIGAVNSGTVDIDNKSLGPTLVFSDNSIYGNISIANESLINFSESIASIRGDVINLSTESNIFSSNLNTTDKTFVNVTSNLFRISNTLPEANTPKIQPPTGPDLDLFGTDIRTGVNTQSIGSAQGASVNLFVNNLELGRNTGIVSFSFQDGRGGDLQVSAQNIIFNGLPTSFDPLISTNTFGTAPSGNIQINSENISLRAGQIVSVSFGSQNSGDIDIDANNINLENGSTISTISFGRSNLFNAGDSGDINITSKKIRLVGESPINFTNSSISASTFGDGDGGQVSILADDIFILDGAKILASTRAAGNSGGIKISADKLSLAGKGQFTGDSSQIGSSADVLPLARRRPLNLPDSVTGFAGDVFITANNLTVKSGAEISVRNQGLGDGGQLFLDIDNISVRNGGTLTASTTSRNGGNIELLSSLVFASSGTISASTTGDGTGGNITINSDLVVAIDGSIISANALNQQGGNIKIDTTGFIKSPDSTITATSQRGEQFDGNVDIDAEITDFSQDPDLNIQTETPDLYSACSATYRNTLAYYRMGNGGQPLSPDDKSSTSQGWLDAANARYAQRHLFYIDTETGEKKPLKRVVGWKSHGDGNITFVSDPKEADQYPAAIAAAKNTCSTEQANNG